jgi:tricorn protease
LSVDGKPLLLRRWSPCAGGILIVDVGVKPPPANEPPRAQVRLSDWQFTVEPREGSQRIFTDVWRMRRDWFYDPAMHGVGWSAIRKKYEALLQRVTERGELSDLIAQTLAELSLKHSQVRLGDLREGDVHVTPAAQGTGLDNARGGVRIMRVYTGDPWLLERLVRPGVSARASDVITALDQKPVCTLTELSMQLCDTAD